MKRKKIFILPLILGLLLSACGGPAPAPTLSVADLQGTAIADAWAAVTQTQAAMPTSTPTVVPPTETPTQAIIVFPTIILQPTVAQGSPTANPCNDVAPTEPKGAVVKIKLVNKSDAPADLHFGMNYANSLGECGIYYFSLGRLDKYVVTVLAGCYWAYAYINGNTPSNSESVEQLCSTDPALEQNLWIGTETIGFHQ